MAKKKMADEVKSADIAPEVSVTVEASAPAVVESKKAKFVVAGGFHCVGETKFGPGDIVESDDDLVAIYANKFKRVE
jgi:hypothetical protein